ncbi:MAG TPA: hypothetical protein VNM72_01900 [Blastocatellia bacterium]|nr:hypothetical protein [Blastocatellia bacterium]
MRSDRASLVRTSLTTTVIFCLIVFASGRRPISAQEEQPTTFNITTIVGGGIGDGLPARVASLAGPSALAVDAMGNIFIADTENHRVRKIDPNGTITTVVGTGVEGFSGDGGPPELAQLRFPRGLAFDKDGNLLIADTGNNRIRRLEKMEDKVVINTLAGSGPSGFAGDGGPAKDAQLNGPRGIAVDASGNIYIADTGNHRIRQIDGTLRITTIAGDGIKGFAGDGEDATKARLNTPIAVAVSSTGDLYIADTGNNRIRRVSAGKITTVAGTGFPIFSGDGGPATAAGLNAPLGLLFDTLGNLLIADTGNNRIRRIDASGIITTVAGSGIRGMGGDGQPALAAQFNAPAALALAPDGKLLIADLGNQRIRSLDASAIVRTEAGGGLGDGGPATAALLNLPYGLVSDSAGTLYIADTNNHRIRKVVASQGSDGTTLTITTIAGTGQSGFSGDGGPAIEARLNFPRGLALDPQGNLYIADTNNHRIRRIDPWGRITTVAGNGTPGFSGDGQPAVRAQLRFPLAVAVDAMGTLYIADAGNNRVRRVDASGIITTVAGTGERGSGGDDDTADKAQLHTPAALAFDKDGNLLIADTGNHKIRKIDFSTMKISTFAGKGTPAFSGDGGAAGAAELNTPFGLIADAKGNVFIADSANHRVRRVDATGNISTFVGSGTPGFGGDGLGAALATINFPTALALDPQGNLILADTFNHRIRKLTPQPPTPPPSN